VSSEADSLNANGSWLLRLQREIHLRLSFDYDWLAVA